MKNIVKNKRDLLVLGLAAMVLLELAWATGYLSRPSLPALTKAPAEAAVTLKLTPSVGTFAVGETFEVELILGAEEGTVTTGVDLKLYFDPESLEVLDVSSLDFYPQRLENAVDREGGIIDLALTNTPDQEETKGGGIIGIITFKALKAGETGIDFEEETIVAGANGVNLTDPLDPKNILPQTTGATFVVE